MMWNFTMLRTFPCYNIGGILSIINGYLQLRVKYIRFSSSNNKYKGVVCLTDKDISRL